MPMAMHDLWTAMDGDLRAGRTSTGGWLLRLARPEAGCPVFAALEVGTHRRAVLLRLPIASVPPRRRWPRCKGLEPLIIRLTGDEYFGIALKEPRYSDVFSSLAEDLVRRIGEAATPDEQSNAFLGQLARWQKFLTTANEGLSEEAQRGLWGELSFLREYLLPIHGSAAVTAWRGTAQAHQDFQFPAGAVEVKTTIASQPQVVRISSARQLDDQGWPILILHVIALDMREGSGETLPALVTSLRHRLRSDVAARERFEDNLLLAGYFDVHVPRYAERGYIIRSQTPLHVTEDFPRLTERSLPPGVGDVTYGLAIASCSSFAIPPGDLKRAILTMATAGQNSSERS